MRNEICVIEIKNKSIRLLIGYLLDDKVKIVYKTKRQLSVSLNDGDVLDIGSLSSDLQQISRIDDKELNFKYLVKEAILVIPSFGLEVYSNTQSTNTISNIGTIETVDIKNVHSLIEKLRIPNENNMFVNIIPNYFLIENDKKEYQQAPLGRKSAYVTLNANVYTLPKKFVSDLYKAFGNANINIVKPYISSLCSTKALMHNDFKYKRFVMVQVGSKNTIVTLVNNDQVTASTYFSLGGDDLTKLIADEFQISIKDAEYLKNTYGLETSSHTYNPVLATALVPNPNVVCNRMTLNAVIQKYLKEMTSNLTNAIKVLLSGFDQFIDKIPLVMFGNTLKLKGLKEALMRTFVNNTIEFPKSNVAGADYSDFINEIGAIYLHKELAKNFQDEDKPSPKSSSILTREGE